ncbi:unnamed protein product [Rotaria magnacalcarata]|uniref:Uncharacterized protein n=1 Tax=Rotaria magnacalcarata TaxID=392030 RepID=A0A8S2LWA3_9BILA|nr:unnamed protein product [Rotaria magnacalcarata]CAF3899509.1 unnamed protein product [Rotaria magnacalcarata]CAF3926096.1 unnamed protein product [Rotaria magnacalcarata]
MHDYLIKKQQLSEETTEVVATAYFLRSTSILNSLRVRPSDHTTAASSSSCASSSQSDLIASTSQNKQTIGTSYSCWYDTRRPSVAQWNKPSTVTAIILLCCGGVSVLLTGLFTFLSVKLVKQEMLQQAHDNMNSYSGSNIFIKQ